MRLLCRPPLRPSAAARSPGSSSCCSGLLLTGGAVRRALPRHRRDQRRPTSRRSTQGRELFLVGCASCHGKNGEGIVTSDGNAVRPVAGRRRRRRGRLPGRHRPDADGAARRPGPAQEGRLHPRGDRRARGVRRLARPRPGDPGRSRSTTPPAPTTRRSSAAASSSAPTAPRATTSPAPAARCRGGKYAPHARAASSAKHIYEAMLTGPQQMPVFSDGVLTPEEKRDIIAYLKQLEDDAELRRLRARRARPRVARACSPGSSASAPWSASPSGSPSHIARARRRESRRERPRRPPATRTATVATGDGRRPDRRPGPARARAPAHRRRRAGREARRAPGRDAVRRCRAVFAVLFVVSYFVFEVGDDPDDHRRATAPPTSRSASPSASRCCCIGIGAIQWARKLMTDDEIVEMRHPAALQRRGPRGGRRRVQAGRRGVRHRPPPADPQHAARRARPARPAGDRAAARPRPAAGRQARAHRLGARACASSTTSPARRSSPRTSRSAS